MSPRFILKIIVVFRLGPNLLTTLPPFFKFAFPVASIGPFVSRASNGRERGLCRAVSVLSGGITPVADRRVRGTLLTRKCSKLFPRYQRAWDIVPESTFRIFRRSEPTLGAGKDVPQAVLLLFTTHAVTSKRDALCWLCRPYQIFVIYAFGYSYPLFTSVLPPPHPLVSLASDVT